MSAMDYRLELVSIPVSDVDRAKTFYAEKVRFNVDHDVGQRQGGASEARFPTIGSLVVQGTALLGFLGILTAVAVRLGRRPRS